jgi:Holliday junction resolvase-like predicted endonuclease
VFLLGFLDINQNIDLVIIIFLSGGILTLILYLKIKSLLDNKKAKQRSFTSKRAEKTAEKWLKRNGFQITEKQQSRPLIIQTGKIRHRYLIRTDFLVRKGGRKYIVEVKSGQKNSHITNRDTRRQLLEYFLAYQSYGIILFDMEHKKFSEIKFLLPHLHSRWVENLIFFLLGALIVMVGIYFLG